MRHWGQKVYARSAAGVVACASAGLGVAVASIWMCAEELASGALTEVLTDYALDPIVAFVVVPRRTAALTESARLRKLS